MCTRNNKCQFIKGTISNKRKDLTGNRYGKLVVLEMIYNCIGPQGGKPRARCVCRCDCGNTITTTADALLHSGKTSCGCDTAKRRIKSLRKDLTGKKFGRLTVLSMDWNTRPTKCLCRCDCGNVTSVANADLVNGHTQSCGCLHKERTSAANTKDFTNTVTMYGVKLLHQYKKNNKGQWLWECECGICGNHFVELPARVLDGHVASCGCAIKSSGERLIENILKKYHYDYEMQYSFDDCRDKKVLHFDFAIKNNDDVLFLIEYDGQQHFKAIDLWGGEKELNAIQKRDSIKNNYCKHNKIPLLRLPYTLTAEQVEDKIVKFYKSLETAGYTWQQVC